MRLKKQSSRRVVVDGLRVLIADDNQDAADSLGLLVKALDHEVCVTYGGVKALKAAADFHPDLMLLDLVMPELDGCELVKLIRQSAILSHTRIVAVTGHQEPEYQASAKKAGFDQVIFKPVALTELRDVLASVVTAIADDSGAMANTL